MDELEKVKVIVGILKKRFNNLSAEEIVSIATEIVKSTRNPREGE